MAAILGSRRFRHVAFRIVITLLTLLAIPAGKASAGWLFEEPVSTDNCYQTARAAAWGSNGFLHVVSSHSNYYIYYQCQRDSVWASQDFLGYGYSPQIAVGPGDIPHVVWYSGAIYYSTRTANGWTGAQQISSYGQGQNPAIAVDASGRVNVAWQDSRNGNLDIYYRALDGSGWGPEVRLTTGSENSYAPTIATDLDGNVDVVWQDNRNGNWELYGKHWNGLAWSADQRITNAQGNRNAPQIAVDWNGVLYLVWQDDRNSSSIYMKTRSGGSWSPEVVVSEDGTNVSNPSVAVDESGQAHIVWQDYRSGRWEICYRLLTDGQLQDEVHLATGTYVREQPCVAARDPQRIAVLWRNTQNGWIYQRQYRDLAAPVLQVSSPPRSERDDNVTLELMGESFSNPDSVWIAATGQPRIIATIASSTPHHIVSHINLSSAPLGPWDVVIQNPDGQRAVLRSGLWIHEDLWSDLNRVNTVWSNAQYPDAATGGDGKVHVVWQDDRDGNWEIYCRHADDTGWTDEERLTHGSSTSILPAIAVGPDGNVGVVWQDDRDGPWKIYYKRWDGSQWSLDLRLTDAYGDSNYPTIAIDRDQRIHVAWQDTRNGDSEIYYKWWNGQVWSGETRLTNSVGSAERPVLAAGPDGAVHLAWQDTGSGVSAIHHMVRTGDTWSAEDVVSDGTGAATRPAIEVDSDGRLHVAWQEDQAGASRIFARWYDASGWSAVVPISPASTTASHPSLTADAMGHSYVVWEDARFGCPQIFYRPWSGGFWLGEERLVSTFCQAQEPAVTATPSGKVRVFWQDTRFGPWSIEEIESPQQYLDPPKLVRVEPSRVLDFGTQTVRVLGERLLPSFVLSVIGPDGSRLEGTLSYVGATEVRYTVDFTRAPLGDYTILFANPAGSDSLPQALRVAASQWSDETRLTTDGSFSNPAYNSGHALAIDAQGRTHLVWSDGRDGNPEIYWKLRDAEGWSSDTRLTTANGASSFPSLAALDSTLVLVWQDARDGNTEIYASFWRNDHWGPQTRVTNTATPSLYPAAAVAADGTVYLVWEEWLDAGAEVFFSKHDGSGWTAPVAISESPGSAVYPTAAWSAQSGLFVAWTDDRDGNWEIYDRGLGASRWGSENRVTNDGHDSWYPSLTSGASGSIYAAWQDDRDGNFEIYGQALDVPDEACRLTQTGGASESPQVTCDLSDVLHLVWTEERDGIAQVYYKTRDGGVWSLDNRISGSPLSVSLPHIAVAADGSTTVIWRDERDGNAEIYALTSGSPGASDAPGAERSGAIAVRFAPNPFMTDGVFQLDLPAPARVQLQIYDLTGRRIRLLGGQTLAAGAHRLQWDARDDRGRTVGSGVYFYSLDAGGQVRTGRVVRMR